MEFLSLASLANVIALTYLISQYRPHLPRVLPAVLFAWLLLFIAAVPGQWERLAYTVDDREKVKTKQFFSVKDYLVTGEYKHLNNKKFRESPFHRSDYLAKILDNTSEIDMLHYNLQAPKSHDNLGYQDTFVLGGTFTPNRGSDALTYNSEPALGSFVRQGEVIGVKKTGEYISEPIVTDRPYLMIPVIGHLGHEGVSLRLKELGKEEYIDISPRSIDVDHVEYWRPIWVETPKGAFQIVAQDNSQTLWFGFALPRTVGKLSYLTERLLKKADDLLKIALLLLFAILFPIILHFFRVTTRQHAVIPKVRASH